MLFSSFLDHNKSKSRRNAHDFNKQENFANHFYTFLGVCQIRAILFQMTVNQTKATAKIVSMIYLLMHQIGAITVILIPRIKIAFLDRIRLKK